MNQTIKSLKKLSAFLYEVEIALKQFNAAQYRAAAKSSLMAKGYSITDETYGSKSFVYITAPTRAARLALETMLYTNGFKVNRQYSPLSNTIEVQVSYFLGWHHDE